MERREVESAEAARQRSARLILVGTYGKGSFRSVIPGSAPHKPLHISEVPVLSVTARGRAS